MGQIVTTKLGQQGLAGKLKAGVTLQGGGANLKWNLWAANLLPGPQTAFADLQVDLAGGAMPLVLDDWDVPLADIVGQHYSQLAVEIPVLTLDIGFTATDLFGYSISTSTDDLLIAARFVNSLTPGPDTGFNVLATIGPIGMGGFLDYQ